MKIIMKKTSLLIFTALLSSVSATPPEKYTLFYSDEFDGSVLSNDWTCRTGERFGGLNQPENVRLEKGNLVIDFKKEKVAGKETYTCGGVINKNAFGYGYYETSSKLYGKGPGLHSSFWLMGVQGDGLRTPRLNQIIEIDAYEVDSHEPHSIKPNVHYYVGSHSATGVTSGTIPFEAPDTSESNFTQGLEWLPNKIRWFVNGKLVREIADPKFYGPQQLWITALATPEWGKPDDGALPGSSRWDYFRYYARALPGANRVANGDFEYNAASGFEKAFTRDLQVPVAWCEEGDEKAAFVATSREAFQGESHLRHFSESPYRVSTYQRQDFLVNGTYRLSAYVRASSTGAVMRVTEQGGDEMRVVIPQTSAKKWEKVVLENVAVASRKAVIAFSSESKGGEFLEVDAVEFVQTDGGDPSEFKTASAKNAGKIPGEIIVDNDMPGYREEGVWEKSSLSGWNLSTSKWSKTRGSKAFWNPELSYDGGYAVSVYNMVSPGSTRSALIRITTTEGVVEKELNQDNGTPGWNELGTFHFAVGKKASVEIGPAPGSPNIRADAVRFVPDYGKKMAMVSVLAVGKTEMFVKGNRERLDPSDPGAALTLSEGLLLVPLTALSRVLNADLSVDLKKQTATLFSGKKATFFAGKNIFVSENGEEPLGGNALLSQNRFTVPLEMVVKKFGLKSTRVSNGLVIVYSENPPFEERKDKAALEEMLKLF
ncbi:MAG: family 16 glycosylhydrolase [Spirochaetia bacterium]|nr:family 16 glycosylhydrolase [Spirochaetia bacterium]